MKLKCVSDHLHGLTVVRLRLVKRGRRRAPPLSQKLGTWFGTRIQPEGSRIGWFCVCARCVCGGGRVCNCVCAPECDCGWWVGMRVPGELAAFTLCFYFCTLLSAHPGTVPLAPVTYFSSPAPSLLETTCSFSVMCLRICFVCWGGWLVCFGFGFLLCLSFSLFICSVS